jgi:Flp pilus assembly protein TadG
VPLLALVLLFVVFCGSLVQARMMVDDTAYSAARAASLSRTAAEARAAAQATALAALTGRGGSCASFDIVTDTSRFVPGGTVAVSITCHESVAVLSGSILPGHVGITSRSASAIDRYRSTS